MKKISITILLISIVITQAISQSCLPYGINFDSQEKIDNFHTNYPGCTEIEGSVMINDQANSNITNLNGLDSISRIGGYLIITENNALTTLSGLENLNIIDGLVEIQINNSLTDLTALNNVLSIGGYLQISQNNSLTSLNSLNSVSSIGGYLNIQSNTLLTNLAGLHNLTTISEHLLISGNPNLNNLVGLENLSVVGGSLSFFNNTSLISIDGLNNLQTVGGDFRLWYNDSLSDIVGFQSLSAIDGDIRINDNPLLMSLEGIENIDPMTIVDIAIHSNNSLTYCEVKTICDYISNPTGNLSIFNNATGCNSQLEIEEACAVNILERTTKQISVFPNPANNEIFISNINGPEIISLTIYNQLGQSILQYDTPDNNIDISILESGIYTIELNLGNLKIREKLIVN